MDHDVTVRAIEGLLDGRLEPFSFANVSCLECGFCWDAREVAEHDEECPFNAVDVVKAQAALAAAAVARELAQAEFDRVHREPAVGAWHEYHASYAAACAGLDEANAEYSNALDEYIRMMT